MLIHQLLLVLHIVAGSVALLLFCAVMAVAKGSHCIAGLARGFMW